MNARAAHSLDASDASAEPAAASNAAAAFKPAKNGAELMAPVGEESLDWIAGFAADKLAISGDRYDTE